MMYFKNIYDNNGLHIIKGTAGFFCKHCYKPIYKEIDYSLRINDDIFVTTTYNIECPRCSYRNIWNDIIDPNIVKYIALLNCKGYETYCCCEGHDYDKPPQPYILFKDTSLQKVIDESKNKLGISFILKNIGIWTITESAYCVGDEDNFIKATRMDCDLKYSLRERLDSLKHFINCLPFCKALNLE